MRETTMKFTLLQIRDAVYHVFAATKEIPLEQVTEATQVVPLFDQREVLRQIGRDILYALECVGVTETIPQREIYTVASFRLWAERMLRKIGHKIVAPSPQEIKTVVLGCVNGHCQLPKGGTPDDLTMVRDADQVCRDVGARLLFEVHDTFLPQDVSSGLFVRDIAAWALDQAERRVRQPRDLRTDRRRRGREIPNDEPVITEDRRQPRE